MNDFFTGSAAGGQLARTQTENKTRSVTLDPSDNDSASYYAIPLAAQPRVASVLANACYGCVSETPG